MSVLFSQSRSWIRTALLVTITGTSSLAAQNVPNAPAQKSDIPSIDNQSDFGVQKAAVDRKLAGIQSPLISWRLVNAALKSSESQISATTGPTTQDFEKLTQSLKSKDFAHAKSQLAQVLNAYQNLNARIFLGNQQIDPEVSLVLNGWNEKLTAITQPLGPDFYNISRFVYNQEPLKAGDINVADLTAKFSPTVFAKYKDDELKLLKSYIEDSNQRIENLTKEQDALQKQSDELATKLTKGKLDINLLAIELGLPLFCGTVLLMLSIPIILQSFSRTSDSSEQVRAIFASGILVEIITVLLLTMSILILGLAQRIDGPVLGTLLGGISGYVLNRFRGKAQQGQNGQGDHA